MNIIILGANGMLGHSMLEELANAQNFNVYGIMRKEMPKFSKKFICIYEKEMLSDAFLTKIFEVYKPHILINCIGITKQKIESKNDMEVITINSLLPHRLNFLCQKYNSKLISFSTDCVFSGQRGNYTINDNPDPLDLYGRSKLMGEVHSEYALTIRTSMIGHELNFGKSFLSWIMAQKNKKIKGYKNFIYSGVTTRYLSKFIHAMIADNAYIHGIWQLSSAPISKFHLLHMINNTYNLKLHIQPDEAVCIDRSLIDNFPKNFLNKASRKWDIMIDEMHKHYLVNKGILYDD